MTECPKCKRNNSQTHHSCIYCGELLAQPAAAKQSVNDVDKKFLESEVKADAGVKNQETQPIHDAFKDRLKDL